MDEYVKREDVIDYLKRKADGYSYIEIPTETILNDINSISAADVRPVVRSKWEQVEVTEITEINMPHAVASMYCPNCKRYHNQVYFYGNPIENVNFCPYCGADMREDDNG